jgi:hypothetical protein
MRVMRGFVRAGTVALAVVSTAACTPTAESQSSSATNPSAWSSNESDAAPRAAAKTAADKPTRWEHMDSLSSFRKAGPRARSQHLGGEHDADVLANEVAAAYPTLGPLRRLPAGSVLVEALYAANQTDVATYFAMIKPSSAASSAWEYAVVSNTGMVERRGALTLCARCHAEAPHDQVFGRSR